MSYVPQYPDHETTDWPPKYVPAPVPAITIHVLKENKRPIGFLPWPEDPEPELEAKPAKLKKSKRKRA